MRPLFSIALFGVVLCAVTPDAAAGLIAHVDYGDFQIRLNQATANPAVDNFTAAERQQIEANVLAGLRRAYVDFDVSFQTTAAGSTERIWLGAPAPAGDRSYGLADRIDYRNRSAGDLARVYTANFDGFVHPSVSRDRQIEELSAALTGTAAHELGHNLGLLHQDSYGNPGFAHTGLDGPTDSGGRQNDNVMATGSTGLNRLERLADRTFSQFSKLKLEFADGLTAAGPTPGVAEVGPNDSPAAAQSVGLAPQSISGFDAANVVGSIGAAFDQDYYAFTLLAPGALTLATITNGLTDAVDAVLTVFDPAGARIGSADDTGYDGDLFGEGTTKVSFDSTLHGLRVDAPGRYLALVEGFDGGTGDYELLVGFNADVAAVPEPGSGLLIALAGLGGVAAGRRRRRLAG